MWKRLRAATSSRYFISCLQLVHHHDLDFGTYEPPNDSQSMLLTFSQSVQTAFGSSGDMRRVVGSVCSLSTNQRQTGDLNIRASSCRRREALSWQSHRCRVHRSRPAKQTKSDCLKNYAGLLKTANYHLVKAEQKCEKIPRSKQHNCNHFIRHMFRIFAFNRCWCCTLLHMSGAVNRVCPWRTSINNTKTAIYHLRKWPQGWDRRRNI